MKRTEMLLDIQTRFYMFILPSAFNCLSSCLIVFLYNGRCISHKPALQRCSIYHLCQLDS